MTSNISGITVMVCVVVGILVYSEVTGGLPADQIAMLEYAIPRVIAGTFLSLIGGGAANIAAHAHIKADYGLEGP